MNYFIHDKRDFSPAYVASCEKFLEEISHKLQAASLKQAIQETVPWNEVLEATSSQASGRKPSSPEPRGQASNPRNSVPGSGIRDTSESVQASGNRKQG